jgi:hypothetical protein
MDGLTTRRGALAAVAALAGGAAIARHGDGASLAADAGADAAVLNLFLTLERDAAVLNLFLTLERVQEGFYRTAIRSGGLSGEPLRLATAVAAQEAAHVARLQQILGDRAEAPPRSRFGKITPASFLRDAVALEEGAIAAYVGQAANLSRANTAAVATLVSVEARQAAWLRDIAGVLPAPHAADPAQPAQDVLANLRKKGWLA